MKSQSKLVCELTEDMDKVDVDVLEALLLAMLDRWGE